MRYVFVIMRALGIELVLNVNTSNPRTDKLAHRAHGVQRFAEAGTTVGNQWYRYCCCNVTGDTDLFIHGQQRLRRAARATSYKAAGIHRRKSKAHDQTSADRVIG